MDLLHLVTPPLNFLNVNMAENEGQVSLVAGVSPKLPDFWPHAVDVWLSQVESQFRVARITVSQTKGIIHRHAKSQAYLLQVM